MWFTRPLDYKFPGTLFTFVLSLANTEPHMQSVLSNCGSKLKRNGLYSYRNSKMVSSLGLFWYKFKTLMLSEYLKLLRMFQISDQLQKERQPSLPQPATTLSILLLLYFTSYLSQEQHFNMSLAFNLLHSKSHQASLVAQGLKCLPPMWQTQVRSPGQEDPLEKEMVTHSSILAWRILWTEKPGRLQSTGSQRVGHN